MTVKLHINLSQGVIDVEGDADFVREVYKDFQSRISKAAASGPTAPNEPIGSEEPSDENGKTKAPRKRSKRSGPSCAERILALKGDGFFKDPRGSADVKDGLKGNGAVYETKAVSAALINLWNRGELRRFDQSGTWMYQNP